MPDTTIDRLTIEIDAEAQNANNAVDDLAEKIGKLVQSFSKIDTDKIEGLAKGMKEFSSSMQGISSKNTNGVARLANSMVRLSKVDVASLSNVASKLPDIAESFNKIGKVSIDAQNFGELASSISRLGNKSATKAIENIPKLSSAMKDLMKNLSTVPKVSQNLIDMTNALAKLARTGASSGKAASSLVSSFQNIGNSSNFALSGIKKINNGLTSFIRKVAPFVGIWQLFSLSKQATEISSDLTEIQNVVDVTFGDFKQKIEDLADTSIANLGMSELTTKEIASRFQAMGTAMGFPTEKMADMSVELTRLTGDMASFYNVAQEDIGKALQSIFTGETEPMRKYGIDLTNATIQQWALNKGLNVSVNKMTQLEKATLRYQYVLENTGAAQGDFIRTQDTWANQIAVLKQQLQQLASVIGGSLINALKPLVKALNTAMSYITAFAQTVSNALGAIFGWKYEVGGGVTSDLETGSNAADDISSGIGDAADNAKKLKSYLLSIDELNVIEPDDDSSSSGSSSGGLGGFSDLDVDYGQWKQTESLLESYKSDIESLYELGKYIGDALIKAMQSINWESIYEKARNFGKGLAEFLNGLISPELFGEFGKTVASALNTAIYAALSFGEEFDWENLGESIASGINDFFATFDFADLANTIDVWVQGIWTTIWTAFKNIKWSKIFSGLLDFLKEIDLSTIFLLAIPNIKKISNLITKLSSKFNTLVKNGKLLIDAFKGNETAIVTLAEKFPSLYKAVDVLHNSFQYLMFGINSGNWTGGIVAAIENIRSNLTLLQKGVISSIAGFAEFKIVSNSFESIVKGTENLIAEIAKISGAVVAAGAAMTLVFGFPAGAIATGIIGIIGAISGINDGIESLHLNSVFETIKTGTTSLETLGNIAKTSFEGISSSVDETIEKINSISQTRESIDLTVDGIGSIKTAIDVGAYSASEKIPEIISQFQSLLSQSKELFNEEYEVIVGNIIGAQADILEAQGQSIPLLVANLAKLRDEGNSAYSELESSMASLTEQYNNGTISEKEFLEQFTPLYEQFKGINSDGSIDVATNAIQNMGGALDMSKYITEDNTFAVDSFRNDVNSVVQTAMDGKDGLEKLAEEQKENIDAMRQQLEALGVDASEFDWDMLYGANEEQVKQTKESIESAYSDYANQVQYSLLEQLPSIVENATEGYENLKWWQKLFMTKEDYVQGEVNQWKDNVLTPATNTLQDGFEELGIEGEAWAGTAAKKMIDSLFDDVIVYSNGIVEPTTNKLKSDWKAILENGLSGAAKAIDAESYGKDTVDGYNKGVKDNSKSTNDAILEWMNSIPTTIHDSDMEFGSPSATAWNFGKDTIDGYNLGIAENTSSSIQAITEWATSILQAMQSTLGIGEGSENSPNSMFSGIITNFNSVWEVFEKTWTKCFSDWKKTNEELYFGEKVWLKNWMNLYNAYNKVWKEFFELWVENFTYWWNEYIVPYFSEEQWTEFGQNMKNGIYGGFKSIVGDITRVLNAIIGVFDSAFSKLESSMNKLIRDYNKAASEMGNKTVTKNLNKSVQICTEV